MEGNKPVGVFTVDRELVVRSWDAWLSDATGVAEADACGRALTELFPEIAQRGFLPRLERVSNEGAVEVLAPAFHHYLIPCALRAPSEHFTCMQQHVTLSPLRANGGVSGIVVTIEDVTARLDRERALAVQLRSHDAAIRLRAAQSLAEDGAPFLVDAIGDESWRVRRVAAQGLARAADRDAIAKLVAAIREHHQDVSVLNTAITALAGAAASAVLPVVELLTSSDADARTYAALALGLLRDERAVPPLLERLGDENANVRFHAIEALGRIGDRRAADAIATVAESLDFSVAFAALDALALIGDPLVAPRVLPLLDDDDLAGPAAECLGRIGGEEVVPALAAVLGRDQAPAASIAVALAELRRRLDAHFGIGALVEDFSRSVIDTAGVARLVAALARANDRELEDIATVLSWLPFDGVDDVLGSLLPHDRVRQLAAEALAKRGDAGAAVLMTALRSDDVEVRKAVVTALGHSGHQSAVPALLDLLRTDPDSAVVIAGALGAIGATSAFDALEALLDDPQASVRQAAVAALSSIAHRGTRELASALIADASWRRREAGARIAGYFGFPECANGVLALCRDPDERVRRAALEHVVLFEDGRAVREIETALLAGSPGVRAAAARAVGQVEDPAASGLLVRALHDDDMWVRYFSARSAARHAHLGAALEQRLVELANSDPVTPVRVAALEGLVASRAEAAVPLLVRLTSTADEEVARTAVSLLGDVSDPNAESELVRLLEGGDPARARWALEALRRSAPTTASLATTKAVGRVAAGEDHDLQELAIEVLGRIGTVDALSILITLTSNVRVRPAVIAAIALFSDAVNTGVLSALRSPDESVRRAVVEALARARHDAVPHLLAAALDDTSPVVRLEAARALSRLDLGDAERQLSLLADSDESAAVRFVARRVLTRGHRAQA
jgi:HEAT repeat protein